MSLWSLLEAERPTLTPLLDAAVSISSSSSCSPAPIQSTSCSSRSRAPIQRISVEGAHPLEHHVAVQHRRRSPDGEHKRRCTLAACNRCRWIKHGAAWKKRCVYITSSGEARSYLVEQPDPYLPWGLGCEVCTDYYETCKVCASKSTVWTSFAVGQLSKGHLEIEDLLRHGNLSHSQASGKVRQNMYHEKAVQALRETSLVAVDEPTSETARTDVPSIGQYSISYNISKKLHNAPSAQYERDCKLARVSGNSGEIPSSRCDDAIHPKIVHSTSESLFDRDRDLFLAKNGVSMIGLVEDARKDFELLLFNIVTQDNHRYFRMLDLQELNGKTTALDHAEHLNKSICDFARGKPEIVAIFRDAQRSFTSDGLFAEQLAPRMAKELGYLPNHAATLRCALHGRQDFLEKAVHSDERCHRIVVEFVTKFAGKGAGEHGALARALANSPRLANMCEAKVKAAMLQLSGDADVASKVLKTLPAKGVHVRTAPAQRFDCGLKFLRDFVFWSRGIVWFICAVASEGGPSSQWAQTVISFLFEGPDGKPSMAILVALLAQWWNSASAFVHKPESMSGKRPKLNLVMTARTFHELQTEMDFMFSVTTSEGSPRMPYCMDPTFKAGFVSLLFEAMRLSERTAIVAAGKVILYREGSRTKQLCEWVAAELGSILNVNKVWFRQLDVERSISFGMALQPLDIEWWQDKDDAKLKSTLAPLVEALHVDADMCVKELISSREVFLHFLKQGNTDLVSVWGETMRHLRQVRARGGYKNLKPLVDFLQCAEPASSYVETANTYLQFLSEQRKAGTGATQLRSQMKILLDGPEPEHFVQCIPRLGTKNVYVASPLCIMAQHKYYKLYGGRDYTHSDRKRESENIVKPPRRDINLAHSKQLGSRAAALRNMDAQIQHARIASTEDARQDASSSCAISSQRIRELATASSSDRWNNEQSAIMKKCDEDTKKKRAAMQIDCEPRGNPQRVEQLRDLQKKRKIHESAANVEEAGLEKNIREGKYLDVARMDVQVFFPSWNDLPLAHLAARKNKFVSLGINPERFHFGFNNLRKMLRMPPTATFLWWIDRGLPFGVNVKIVEDEAEHDSDRASMPAMAARLFGGYLIDDKWLATCSVLKERQPGSPCLVRPMLRLEAAVGKPQELYVHESVKDRCPWLHKLFSMTYAPNCGPRSQWVMRVDRKTIKNTRTGWAIFANDVVRDDMISKRNRLVDQSKSQTTLPAARKRIKQELLEHRGVILSTSDIASRTSNFSA